MKIIEVFGYPLSGMKILLVETEDKKLVYIYGDWRMIDHIIENEGGK